MEKYRILKITKSNDLNDKIVTYKVQRKFLFWYIDLEVRSIFYTKLGGAILKKISLTFDNLESAEILFNFAKENFKEIYKGNKIVKALINYDLKFIYVNLDASSFEFGDTSYDCSEELDKLKRKIDFKITKVKKEVIK